MVDGVDDAIVGSYAAGGEVRGVILVVDACTVLTVGKGDGVAFERGETNRALDGNRGIGTACSKVGV